MTSEQVFYTEQEMDFHGDARDKKVIHNADFSKKIQKNKGCQTRHPYLYRETVAGS